LRSPTATNRKPRSIGKNMNTALYLSLIARMLDPSLTVAQRNDACFELRGVSTLEVTVAMSRALGDPKIRACAGINLRRVSAVDELKVALAEGSPEVRALAARELGSFEKPELLPLLAQTARDPQLLVATNAVEGLANYRDPVVVPYLLDIAKTGGLVGVAALNRALAFHDDRIPAVARELLSHPDISDKLAAMRVLGDVGDASDVPALRQIAETETGTVSSKSRGFGLMPAISLSRAAQTAIEQIQTRRNKS
jgi:HEAT repeat protein